MHVLHASKTPPDKINKILFQAPLVENFNGSEIRSNYSNKNSEIIQGYFRTNGSRKWRNRFKKEKFVVLAEYFEQQTDPADIEEKLAKQGEVLCGEIFTFPYQTNWNHATEP